MPKGVYIRTEYHSEINRKCHLKENLSAKALLGLRYKRTEYHREINRQAHLGIKHTEETKRKLSIIFKGRKFSDEWRRKIGEAHKGKIVSQETRLKMSNNIKGKTYEERLGKEKATMIKLKQRLAKLGKDNLSIEGRKKLSEQMKGDKNPSWAGGIAYIQYGRMFNIFLKQKVKQYYRNQCFLCGTTKKSKRVCVHHIDYNKQNNNMNNLVLLCFSCHSVTGKNRDFWFNLFKQPEDLIQTKLITG